MRRILFILTTLLLVSCNGRDDGTAPADKAKESVESTTAPQGQTDDPRTPQTATSRPPIDVVVGLICDDAATRISSDAEVWSGQSWKCPKSGEEIRIDFYLNDTEQRKAKEQFLGFYSSAGDNRPLAQLPIVCGTRFGIRSDTIATRDALITELTAAEIRVSTCQ